MSDNALVFGGDLVDTERSGIKSAGYWKVSNSMYVTVLKAAIGTVLQHESFLLTDTEISYLKGLQNLDTDAFYLLARLALRKSRWYRYTDFARYAEQLGGEAKLESACKILCNRVSGLVSGGRSDLSHKPVDTVGTIDAPIDLTCDDSETEDETCPQSSNDTETPTASVGAGANTSDNPGAGTSKAYLNEVDLSYHAQSHEEAELIDLLEMLKAPELEDLSKQMKLSGKKKKASEIVAEILEKSSTQSILSFSEAFSHESLKGKEKQPLRQLHLNFKPKTASNVLSNRLKAICLRLLGSCIRINKGVMAILRRINLVFFRTTAYDAHMFVPAILVACKKRKYSAYRTTRTNIIFSDRQSLLEYENALDLEQQFGQLLFEHPRTTTVTEKQILENRIIDLYNQVISHYKEQQDLRNDDRQGLERFEAGYVFVRILHHMAFTVGKICGTDTELNIFTNLVLQGRWLLGKRGGWYDRIACIHMKNSKNKECLEQAYDVVKTALLDPETRLQFRPKLVRRLERLEKSLNIPLDDCHQSQAYLTQWKEIYILGERIDMTNVEPQNQTTLPWVDSPTVPPTMPARRGSGRTAWKGAAGVPITVENFALEHYAKEGYKGKHCEGKTVRFLFALLFHDILFHAIPGAFETEYQTAPLDLVLDTFYSSRKSMIDQRLSEILGGSALEIASKADAKHRPQKTFFVGAQWDTFSTEEILEIIKCLPCRVLHAICEQQALDYPGTGGGVPDLIIWKPEEEKARFVEVKSPSDKLSETQKLWLHVLETADDTVEGMVEVCHVETLADRRARMEKGREQNTPKAAAKKKAKPSVKRSADEEPLAATTTTKRRRGEKSAPIVIDEDDKL